VASEPGEIDAQTVLAQIDERIRRLVEVYDPTTTEAGTFLGAQYDEGLAWVNFPVGLGGLGVSPNFQSVVNQRLSELGAPGNFSRNGIGVGMAAPVIETYGSEEHKHRFFRPMFACEEIWCQLFSEPGAGSDVASLATRATRDGDQWEVNGQKVWTTLAHVARWGLLLARTDPDVPKHNGLTYFIVDMHAPGVEVLPLRQMTGEAEFNEVFFTDVRIADSERLGPIGDGWRVAITTLMNERLTLGTEAARGDSAPIGQALRMWDAAPVKDPVARSHLAALWVEAEVVRLTALRAQQMREAGVPGPEGSTSKLAATELAQRIHAFSVHAMGAKGMLNSGYEMTRPDTIYGSSRSDAVHTFLRSVAHTIEGGTSNIMRNILAERVLGLPGEPRDDRLVPWSDVRR
jgi:alkylation response protein AidB-like acyl-CoA dehydrogenase